MSNSLSKHITNLLYLRLFVITRKMSYKKDKKNIFYGIIILYVVHFTGELNIMLSVVWKTTCI